MPTIAAPTAADADRRPRLEITDATGLRLALDGAAEYLRTVAVRDPAGALRMSLESIASLLAVVPGKPPPFLAPRLHLATEDAATVERLAAMPHAHRDSVTSTDDAGVIHYAIAPIDGIEVSAQHRVERSPS